MSNLEIQTNKLRIAFITFIHFLTLILGIATIYYLYQFGYIAISLIVIFSVFLLIFPVILYINLKIILNPEAGLIISEKGILDNIQMTKFGLIEWKNIKGIRKTRIYFSDILLLDVLDKELLINGLSRRQKNNAENNLKKLGTPCAINMSNLKFEKEKLLKIIDEKLKEKIN